MKKEMTCLKRTNDLFTIRKRLIERLEMTCLALVNDLFNEGKVHIKSVWEKNEESLLVISYFPHFG